MLLLAHVYGAIVTVKEKTSIPSQLQENSAYKSNKKEDLCSGYNIIQFCLRFLCMVLVKTGYYCGLLSEIKLKVPITSYLQCKIQILVVMLIV